MMAARAKTSTWLLQHLAVQVLREVVTRACDAGLPVLPVKGIVTSRELYQDATDRPFSDVDVRIRPRDFAAFRGLGERAGWECVRVARSYANLVYRFPPLALDVECHVGPPGLCGLTTDAMLSRAATVELVPGLVTAIPELHDHTVLLAVNAFKDKISHANDAALADLERIVLRPGFERALFLRRVREAGARTITWTVASWLHRERRSEQWAGIRDELSADPRTRISYGKTFLKMLPRPGMHVPLRVYARMGADAPLLRMEALGRAALWLAEMRLCSAGCT